MANFTSNTYQMKRKILNFTNKISRQLSKPELKQDYVIRLTSKRKLLYHGKWTPAAELRDRRKGKIKTSVFYKGKNHEAYLSHVKVQITASRKDIYLRKSILEFLSRLCYIERNERHLLEQMPLKRIVSNSKSGCSQAMV